VVIEKSIWVGWWHHSMCIQQIAVIRQQLQQEMHLLSLIHAQVTLNVTTCIQLLSTDYVSLDVQLFSSCIHVRIKQSVKLGLIAVSKFSYQNLCNLFRQNQ
jgi:hypothetical protein